MKYLTKTLIQRLILRFNNERKFGRFWSEFWLHHVSPNAIFRLWFILPYNGQSRRLFNIEVLAFLFKPTYAIETGTFFGSSTYVFVGIPTVKKVFSFESNKEYYAVARDRYSDSLIAENLELILGSSVTCMQSVLEKLNPETERLICYLDAHWEGDIPTTQEVRTLLNWGGNFIAIVDDFFVPGEQGSGYGYDSYEGIDVGPKLFESYDGLNILIPKVGHESETGAKRGTGYLIGGSEARGFAQLFSKELDLIQL